MEWQTAILEREGIPERRTYTDALPARKRDPRKYFGELERALRAGDVLAVPCLAVFARNRDELRVCMRGLKIQSVHLWSIEDEIDTRCADGDLLFKLGRAEDRAVGIWNRERTVTAFQKGRLGRRMGRRPTLGPKADADARALWLDIESENTSEEIAKLVGLSANRLYRKFGKRPRG